MTAESAHTGEGHSDRDCEGQGELAYLDCQSSRLMGAQWSSQGLREGTRKEKMRSPLPSPLQGPVPPCSKLSHATPAI